MTLKFLGAFALLLLAACDQDASTNPAFGNFNDAEAAAKSVSGDATTGLTACEAIYFDIDGDEVADADEWAKVYGMDFDTDGYAGEPNSFTNIFAEVEADTGTGTDAGGATYVCSFTWPSGYVLVNDVDDINADCDDATAMRSPGITEECGDSIDNDCDLTVDETGTATVSYPDADHDGYGDSSAADSSCVAPVGNIANGTDCDDNDVNTFPGAAPEDSESACMTDADGDGYGDDSVGDGITAGTDCDDVQTADIEINPGMEEICNGVDDNCGGFVDIYGDFVELDEVYLPDLSSSEDADGLDAVPFYSDDDGDGAFGTFEAYACVGSATDTLYSATSNDCNDSNSAINPAATEICDAGSVDENCNGFADDADGSATGKVVYYADVDVDMYGGAALTAVCDQPSGSRATSTDCNDSNAAINPVATEICDSGSVDEDCDGSADDADGSATGKVVYYADVELDMYGGAALTAVCDQPSGSRTTSTDCDDAIATVYPGATESCNMVDDDCDGTVDDGVQTTYYRDVDTDTYGNLSVTYAACSLPSGYVTNSTDCDDADSSDHPGGTEVCNGDDEDCDSVVDDGVKSTVYPDTDGDGYGDEDAVSSSACVSSTMVLDNTDCNDGNSSVNPYAADPDNDGSDQDCDGETMDQVCTTLVSTYTLKSYQIWFSDRTVYTHTPSDPGWVAPGYAQGTSVPVCGSFLLVEGHTLKFNAIIDNNGDGTYGNSGDAYGFTYPGTNNFSSMTIMGESLDMANVSVGGDVTQIPWTWGTYTGNDGSVLIPALPN